LREYTQVLPHIPQIFDLITFEVIQVGFDKIDESFLEEISIFSEDKIIKIKAIIRHIMIFFERIDVFEREDINFLIDF